MRLKACTQAVLYEPPLLLYNKNMNNIVSSIVEKIKKTHTDIDTVLIFGSATTEGWTTESDIDAFLIDDSFDDSRSEETIDGVLIEYQEGNFEIIKKHIEAERGNLLHRNLSTMIATAQVASTNSPEKVAELVSLAKDVLSSKFDYTDEDIKLWRYSILDYLAKAKKDVIRNDEVAFYFDAHYVLQNALEMSLALNGAFMPQPKSLAATLKDTDPDLLTIWKEFMASNSIAEKLDIISKLSSR